MTAGANFMPTLSQIQSDAGNAAAKKFGLEKAPETLELGADRIAKTVRGFCVVEYGYADLFLKLDNATRDGTSGKFLNLRQGTEMPF
ncbi:Short-chain dehydrogenase RED3 [Paramyrothecium foliicola]|nr:Short-chain dehydrogenase RED3 [Paramyrothecium foliicola]